MTRPTFDRSELQKLTRHRPTGADAPQQQPPNGISTPSPDKVREAVREANDPKRLISDPQNFTTRR